MTAGAFMRPERLITAPRYLSLSIPACQSNLTGSKDGAAQTALRKDRRMTVSQIAELQRKLAACALALMLPWVVQAQPTAESPSTTSAAIQALAAIPEPPEIKDAPATPPAPVPAYLRQIGDSKALQAADPARPETLEPAIRDLDAVIKQAPGDGSLYALRASAKCMAHADPKAVIADLDKSIALHKPDPAGKLNLQLQYTLRARMDLAVGDAAGAIDDLMRSIEEDLHFPQNAFNDGKVTTTKASQPCEWSLDDLGLLAKKYPQDARPLLLKGIYFMQFHLKDADDHAQTLALYDQASKLTPNSPLPYYLTGLIYISPSVADKYSLTNAKCIDDVVPRTEDCKAADKITLLGMNSLTAALAIDPKFIPAYEERSEAFWELKQYRQAIRDYTDALTYEKNPHRRAILYGDRGLSRFNLGDYQGAVEDQTQSIRLDCTPDSYDLCFQYENRAESYRKLGQVDKAISDLTSAIRSDLSTVMVMGLGTFRRLYPEYDPIRDDIVIDRLRVRFAAGLSYSDFAKSFAVKQWGLASSVLSDLYIKRGDLYAREGRHALAKRDYDRIVTVYPNMVQFYFRQVNGHRVRLQEDEE